MEVCKILRGWEVGEGLGTSIDSYIQDVRGIK